jgi:metal-responsive CopG/Arc/MetJ family transcriptional regulator
LEVSIVPNANYREASVKYTTVLPKECLNELKALTEKKVIPSVSQGIRRAVEDFVTVQKQNAYKMSMREAAADTAFIKRTVDTQNDFAGVDAEGEGVW